MRSNSNSVKNELEMLEKIQVKITKLTRKIKCFNYPGLLSVFGLTELIKKRIHGFRIYAYIVTF